MQHKGRREAGASPRLSKRLGLGTQGTPIGPLHVGGPNQQVCGGSCTQLLLPVPGPPHCLLLGPSLTAPRPPRRLPSFSVPSCGSLSPFPDRQLLPSPFCICLPTCPAPGAVAKPQAGSLPSRDSRVNHRTLPTPSSWPALGSAEAAGRACAASSAPARWAGGTSDQPRASRVCSLAPPSGWPGARGSGPTWVQIPKRLRSTHPNLSLSQDTGAAPGRWTFSPGHQKVRPQVPLLRLEPCDLGQVT